MKSLHEKTFTTSQRGLMGISLPPEEEGLKGADLFVRRVTYVPSYRNFTSLKFVHNIKEHYDFSDKIGEGSYGTVTLATHTKSKSRVAIKTVKKRSLSDNPLLPQLMLNELLILK